MLIQLKLNLSLPIDLIELIDSIVAVAESTSDELSQNDGYEIKLEEDIQLQLPFLLPEEGYSSDIIRGVPPGLQEFLEPLCSTGRLICFPLDYLMWSSWLNSFQPSIAFHVKTSHFICSAYQITGFYME